MLIALILLVGMAVTLMFLIWLTTVLVFTADQVPVVLVENPAGRGDHAEGLERDVEPPGAEELEEVTEPQIENLLEAVTDVVSTQAAALDSMATDAPVSSKGGGLGDSRPPGPLGEGDDIIPRWERWQIQYDTGDISAYAAQLDFFHIELGAIGGGRTEVDYAINVSKARPDSRSGTGDAEKRLYMTWTSGTLADFDRQLLVRAGIPVGRRIIVQFYPKPVEDRLAYIEMEAAAKKKPEDLTPAEQLQWQKSFAKTIFGVRRAGSGYEYYVVSQKFRG